MLITHFCGILLFQGQSLRKISKGYALQYDMM